VSDNPGDQGVLTTLAGIDDGRKIWKLSPMDLKSYRR